MSRTLPKKSNPLILSDAAPPCKFFFVAARDVVVRPRMPPRVRPIVPRSLDLAIANPSIFAIADDELLARRRLGKTNLSVKPGLIGSSNATKPENLGVFEYAHLRAPLPKDLKGSQIFPSHTPSQHPETYFLMVSDYLLGREGACDWLLTRAMTNSGGARMAS